jgi:hypothetical protein
MTEELQKHEAASVAKTRSEPDGYNGCYREAIAALNYLASNPRPSAGQQRFNAEHLLQIANEMKRSRLSGEAAGARTWHDAMADRVLELKAAGTNQLSCDAVLGLIAFVRDGEGSTHSSNEVNGVAAGARDITISLEVARLINGAFLPLNPRKLRTALPETIEAVEKFKAAIASALSSADGNTP